MLNVALFAMGGDILVKLNRLFGFIAVPGEGIVKGSSINAAMPKSKVIPDCTVGMLGVGGFASNGLGFRVDCAF